MRLASYLLLLVAMSCMAPVASAQSATTQRAFDGRYARRHIAINVLPPPQPDWGVILPEMHEQAESLGLQILNSRRGDLNWLKILAFKTGGEEQRLSVIVDLREHVDMKPVAEEFADALVQWLVERVEESYSSDLAQRFDPLRRNFEELERRTEKLKVEAEALRQKMSAAAGRSAVSAQMLRKTAEQLEEEEQKLDMDLHGKEARREALEDAVAELSKQVQQRVEDDPIVAELQKVVEAREMKVKRTQEGIGKGAFTEGELSDVVATAAESRAKLMERKEIAAAEAGGEMLKAFNHELLSLSVDLRELDARLAFIQDRLPKFLDALSLSSELQMRQMLLEEAQQQLAQLQEPFERLKKMSDNPQPPRFTVTPRHDAELPPE